MASSSPDKELNCSCLMSLIDFTCTENKTYTMIYVLKIHRAELTQAELTQGRVDSGADLTSGRVDPLPLASPMEPVSQFTLPVYLSPCQALDSLTPSPCGQAVSGNLSFSIYCQTLFRVFSAGVLCTLRLAG